MKDQDLTGRTVGRMRVVGKHGDAWHCQCRCGKEPVFTAEELRTARSCGCIVILGIDPATNTGWAVRYLWRDPSAIICGTFNVGENDRKEDMEWEEKYALAANLTLKLLQDHVPDFVAIEEPEHGIRKFVKKSKEGGGRPKIDIGAIKSFLSYLSAVLFKHGMESPQAAEAVQKIAGGSSNSNQLQLSGIVGAIVGACMSRRVPYGTIGARSWHSFHYRKGTKPDADRDWKDIAIETCEQESVPLPSTKKEKRDAAEAVGISNCWTECKIPKIKWMQERFMALRTGATRARHFINQQRNNRSGGDLFGSAA